MDAGAGVDLWEDRALLASLPESGSDPWEGAEALRVAAADLLRSQGVRDCRSLRGGLKSVKTSA